MNQTNGKNGKRVLVIILSVLPVIVAWWFVTAGRNAGPNLGPGNGPNGGGNEVADGEVQGKLKLHRVALADMESLESIPADAAWQKLHEAKPKNLSIAINRALNRIITIDSKTEAVNDAATSDEDKKAIRQTLPGIISSGRTAVADYQANGGDAATVQWMNSRIDLREATLLPRSMTRSIRRDVFDRLTQGIESLPDDAANASLILLAGPLTEVIDQLEDPIEGIPSEILQPAAKSLAKLSNLQPNNLYLAVRAARMALAAKSDQAVSLIQRTSDLAVAIQPTLSRQTAPIGKTPQGLVDEIVQSVQAQEFEQASNQMLLWFNLLNSTELIKTDRRRVNPHPLDLISFDSLRAVAEQASSLNPIKPDLTPVQWQLHSTTVRGDFGPCRAMATIDADLDLIPELLTLHRNDADETTVLRLSQISDNQLTEVATLTLEGKYEDMLVADWFMVDSSSPGRLRVNGASDRHNTLQSVLVYGPAGVRCVIADLRETDAENAESLRLLDEELGIESLKEVSAMTTGDLEGDGDLDLIAATPRGFEIFVNRGNRTFFAVPGVIAGPTNARIADLAIVDLDRDLDLDVVSIDAVSGEVGWVENLLHLQFRYAELPDTPQLPGATDLAVEDVDGNVSWDLIAGAPSGGVVIHSQTAAAGQWRVESVVDLKWNEQAPENPLPGTLLVADFDNDAFFECLYQGASDTMLQLSGNESIRQRLEIQADTQPRSRVAVVDDFDGDRTMDLAISVEDQSIAIATQPAGKLAKRSIAIRFKGIDDNNANSGRVNHYAVGSVLEMWLGPHYRSKVVTTPTTHFGLDNIDGPISLRVIFPNGLTQTIENTQAGELIEEEQTLKGSCPYLYAFDGEKYQFVTDCLWAAPLGLQVSPGTVVPDRPWEHLKIDGRLLKPHDGKYELRITEELWEIAYFDQLKLSRVSHPKNVEVFTNEKVGPPQLAEPKIHAFTHDQLQPVAAATDSQGRDATELLAKIDNQHVQGFAKRYRQGVCPEHFIELDLSSHLKGKTLNNDVEVKLVLTGWILPTDTSLNIQIDQDPSLDGPRPPSLWRPAGQSDRWEMVQSNIGFPGGKNKTIVVDVSEHVRADEPRLRVQTTMQIYWDAVAVVVRSRDQAAQVETTLDIVELPLLSATVAEHGFSRRIQISPTHAEVYDYQVTSSQPRWPPLDGELTRLGPVTELLTQWDDQMVVIAGGDEIRLQFADEPPAESESMTCDFMLYGVGWDKDADLNTLTGQSSYPLPWREMQSYPPKAGQFMDSQQVHQSNQHHLNRRQSFGRFWKRPF